MAEAMGAAPLAARGARVRGAHRDGGVVRKGGRQQELQRQLLRGPFARPHGFNERHLLEY
jgi:hypothetical protein